MILITKKLIKTVFIMEGYFPGAGFFQMVSEQLQTEEPVPSPAPMPHTDQTTDPNIIYAEPINQHVNKEIISLKKEIIKLKKQILNLENENKTLKNQIKLDETIQTVYQSIPSFSQIEKAACNLKNELTKE